MSFLKNKWVLLTIAAVGGFLAWRWWQARQAATGTTAGAAPKAQ